MTPDRDFIAAMSAGIPPMHPDPIAADEDMCRCSLRTKLVGDGCQYCNPELHADLSADEAEHETENGLFAGPEWAANLPTLSPDEIAEGDARQEHC